MWILDGLSPTASDRTGSIVGAREWAARSEPVHFSSRESLDDIEARARQLLVPEVYDFVAGGAGDEGTLRRNRTAFAAFKLLPRIMRDVSAVDCSTQLFGATWAAPMFASPTAGQALVHPEAEVATARGVADNQIGYILSSASSTPLETIAEIVKGIQWFQFYMQEQRSITADMMRRAEAAGYSALVLTVDQPVRAVRRRMLRNEYEAPTEALSANFRKYNDGLQIDIVSTVDRTLNWKDVDWLRAQSGLPLLLKGVMTHEDVLIAKSCGIDGVIVSNHGGRQVDNLPAPIEVLEDLVAAAGEMPILVDGGVRKASDVVTCLALGARAVGIGRPIVWAVACGGSTGVSTMLSEFIADLKRMFALIGATSVQDIDRAHIMHTPTR